MTLAITGGIFGASAVLTVVFGLLYLRDRRADLGTWALAWAVHGMWTAGLLMQQAAPIEQPPDQMASLALAVSSLIFFRGFFLVQGRRMPWPVYLALPVIIVILVLSSVRGWHMSTYLVPVTVFQTVLFIWGGISLLRWRQAVHRGFGPLILAIALITYGAHNFGYPILMAIETTRDATLIARTALIALIAAGLLTTYFEQASADARRLQERLLQSQKMEALGRLTGGIAHNFNNLLTVVLSNVEMVSESRSLPAEDRSLLEAVSDSAHRAANLTAQLLTFSRQSLQTSEVVDLTGLVANTGDMLRRTFPERIVLTVDTASHEIPVRGDPGQLQQVLLNLAINARDAIDEEGKIDIRLTQRDARAPESEEAATCTGPCAVLEVSDDGAGMDEETIERLFDPFFTTRLEDGGTGLGLSTAYGTVLQARGTIEVESAPNAGATFRVLLPVSAEATPAVARDAVRRSPADEPRTVLVVEDEAPLRDTIRRVLRRAGYEVVTAENGRHALEVVSGHSGTIDLLLADLVMPELGGAGLARRLRERDSRLPIVLMSGYADNEVGGQGELPVNSAFLSKPFGPDRLLEVIARILAA